MGPPGSSLALAQGRMHPYSLRGVGWGHQCHPGAGGAIRWARCAGLHSAQGEGDAENNGCGLKLAQRLPLCSSSLLLSGTELSTKHQNLLFSRCLRAVLSAVLQAGGAAWQAGRAALDVSAEHRSKTWLVDPPSYFGAFPLCSAAPGAGICVFCVLGRFGAQAGGSAASWVVLGPLSIRRFLLGVFCVSFLLPSLCPSRRIAG